MKTFEQLQPEVKQMAVDHCVCKLLEDITVHGIRFNDELNEDDLQKRIDAAGVQAEKMHTPWFWSEYIMDTCKDEITGMAQCEAEDALYSEENENVISLRVITSEN